MNLLNVLLIAAVVIYVIVRRFAGQPLTARTMVIPLALTAIGGYQLVQHHLTAVDIAVIAAELVLGLAVGAVRGTTIKIYERGGHLWQRYQLTTLAVWIVAIALRIGIAFGGHAVGADVASGSSIMLMVGASLIAESGVVGLRAARTGVPFAPSQRRSRLTNDHR
jgi:hypothetical protein